jgi:hypothetical protein
VACWLLGNGSGSVSVGRGGWWGSTARPSAMSWLWSRMTSCCGLSCGRSRVSDRGGDSAKAHQRLLDQGWHVNRKRTQWLWRQEGLRVPPKRCKRHRRGDSTVPGERLGAQRPDHVWAFDFQFDVTEDGRGKGCSVNLRTPMGREIRRRPPALVDGLHP